MKKMIITCLVASVALGFTIPEGAENGNERVSYSLAGKKVAVAITRIVLRIPSADLVSKDSVSEDKQ